MRILFLAGRDNKHPRAGGGDIQAWEFARYMAEGGHEVCYVSSGGHGFADEEVAEGVRIKRLGNGPALLFRTFLFYIRHRREFDIVYEDVIGGSRLPYLAPLYVDQPVIAAWHQVNGPLFRESYPALLASALALAERALATIYRKTHVRVPSEEQKAGLHRELGLRMDRLHVIPASIPQDWLTTNQQNAAREPLVVYLGNFRRYKAIHVLVEALPLVFGECGSAKAVIAGRRGEEDYERELHGRVVALGLADRVRFAVNISENEKKSLLGRARVLVLPSRLEGFGIAVLEANACGVPVVASSGVPSDAVRDGWNGLRVPFGDARALAGATVQLLNDDDLHARLSRNAVNHARLFGLNEVGAQFEKLVQNVVLGQNAQHP